MCGINEHEALDYIGGHQADKDLVLTYLRSYFMLL